MAGIFVFVLGSDWFFPAIGQGAVLAVETLHLAADTFFEVLFGLAPEAAQVASAWTGLFALIALLFWGGGKFKRYYHRAKLSASNWWAERIREMKAWWAALPWTQKLAHMAGAVMLLSVLVLALLM